MVFNLPADLCAGALVLLSTSLMRMPGLRSSAVDGHNEGRNMLRVI